MTPYGLMAHRGVYGAPHALAQSAALQRVARRDPHGDTIVAQINPREAATLRAMGGADVVNPRTGLRQFMDDGGIGGSDGAGGLGGMGSGGMDGGGGTSGAGGDPRVGGLGMTGGYRSGGYAGGYGGYGGSYGGYGGPAMGGSSGGYNSTSQLGIRDPITSAQLKAQSDYHNVGNTALDNIGNAIASAFGFNEIDPTKQGLAALQGGYAPPDRASWGFDPAGLIGGVAGGAFGVPGLGLLTDKISQWAGRPMQVSLGPDVFGGSSSWGGGSWGSGTGGGQLASGGAWGAGSSRDPMAARSGAIAAAQTGLPTPAGAPTPAPVPGATQVAQTPAATMAPPWTAQPGLNPYQPWRTAMSAGQPNLGALPFALPSQPAPWWMTANNKIGAPA